MVEECSESQDRSLTGAKVPDVEHGTEVCGEWILILRFTLWRVCSQTAVSWHEFSIDCGRQVRETLPLQGRASSDFVKILWLFIT